MVSRELNVTFCEKGFHIFFSTLLAMETGGIDFGDFNFIEKRFRGPIITLCFRYLFFSDFAHTLLSPFS